MKLIVTLTICSFFLGVFPPVLAEGGDIDLTIEGETLSAKLRRIPLKILFEKLKREKGILFRGDPSLLEKEITVQLAELSFEEGLKRILASMNYSLIYDRNERLVGVIIIGRGIADNAASEGRAGASKGNERADVNRSFTVMKNNLHHGGNLKIGTEERENFRVISDSPPSAGVDEFIEQESENFGGIKNSLPPGGPVKVTEKERKNFRVIRNSPPPGGHVKVTEEELENFKIVRNCPPSGN